MSEKVQSSAPQSRQGLTKEIILKALTELSDALARENIKGELCLFGGTVMVLAFAARHAHCMAQSGALQTRHVDPRSVQGAIK